MKSLPLWFLVSLPVVTALVFVLLMVPVWQDWRSELYKSQQAALQVTADGIAAVLAEDPRYRQFLEDEVAEVTYRAVPLDEPVQLDGRRDEWSSADPVNLGIDQLLETHGAYSTDSLQVKLSTGATRQYLYLHLAVTDDFIVYRELNGLSVHRNDHIQLAAIDRDGLFRRFTVSVLQPGDISVSEIGVSGRALREVAEISGRWLATEAGYNVELRIPRQLVRHRFSVAVGDVDNEGSRDLQSVVGLSSTRAAQTLGTLIYSPTELERTLAALPYPVQVESLGGVALSTADFSKMDGYMISSAAIRAGDFSSGTLSIAQPNAPSRTTALAMMMQTLAVFFLTLLLMVAVLVLAIYLMHRRLAEVRDALAGQLAGGSVEPSHSVPGDGLEAFRTDLSALLARQRQQNDYLERMASRLNHELRTPVSVVKSSLENLQSELPEGHSVYVERAVQGVARLTNILNKMGEARRLEEALDEDEVRPFDLCEVVSGCVAGYETAFPDRHFELRIEEQEAPVTGIPELIAQLLDKLVDNAVDFSGSDTIRLRLHREDGDILLRVLNEGPELPEGAGESLFSSMVSVRETDSDTHLGLGLYIARTIARFHGGDLTAANREDAKGVIVTLRLPVLRLSSKLAPRG